MRAKRSSLHKFLEASVQITLGYPSRVLLGWGRWFSVLVPASGAALPAITLPTASFIQPPILLLSLQRTLNHRSPKGGAVRTIHTAVYVGLGVKYLEDLESCMVGVVVDWMVEGLVGWMVNQNRHTK